MPRPNWIDFSSRSRPITFSVERPASYSLEQPDMVGGAGNGAGAADGIQDVAAVAVRLTVVVDHHQRDRAADGELLKSTLETVVVHVGVAGAFQCSWDCL